jgi:hypothetical protein
MEIIIKQTLTAEDHYEYNMHHIAKKSKMMYFPFVTGFIMLAIGVVAFITSKDYWVAAFAVLFALYSFLWYPKSIRRRVRNSIAQNPRFNTPLELNLLISEEGVKITSDDLENQPFLEWAKVLEVVEGAAHYYMYIAKNQAIIVSKAFLSDEMTLEFKQMIEQYLQPSQIKYEKKKQ